MAKDILSSYGPDSSQPQAPRSTCGGVEMKDVKPLPYSPPKGPTSQMHSGPGLHGTNHGKSGSQK